MESQHENNFLLFNIISTFVNDFTRMIMILCWIFCSTSMDGGLAYDDDNDNLSHNFMLNLLGKLEKCQQTKTKKAVISVYRHGSDTSDGHLRKLITINIHADTSKTENSIFSLRRVLSFCYKIFQNFFHIPQSILRKIIKFSKLPSFLNAWKKLKIRQTRNSAEPRKETHP